MHFPIGIIMGHNDSSEYLGTASAILEDLGSGILIVAASATAASIVLLGLVGGQENVDTTGEHENINMQSISISKILISIWIVSTILIAVLPIVFEKLDVSLALVWVALIYLGLALWCVATILYTYISTRLRRHASPTLRLQVSLIQTFVIGGIVFLGKFAYTIVSIVYDFRPGSLAFFTIYMTIVLILSMFFIAYTLLDHLRTT